MLHWQLLIYETQSCRAGFFARTPTGEVHQPVPIMAWYGRCCDPLIITLH